MTEKSLFVPCEKQSSQVCVRLLGLETNKVIWPSVSIWYATFPRVFDKFNWRWFERVQMCIPNREAISATKLWKTLLSLTLVNVSQALDLMDWSSWTWISVRYNLLRTRHWFSKILKIHRSDGDVICVAERCALNSRTAVRNRASVAQAFVITWLSILYTLTWTSGE